MRETTDKEEGPLGGWEGQELGHGAQQHAGRATLSSGPGARASQGGNTKLEGRQGWSNSGVDVSKASTECATPPPFRGRPSRGGGYDELMGAGRQDPALLEPPQYSAKQNGPQNSVQKDACTPFTAEGSRLYDSSPQTLALVPST